MNASQFGLAASTFLASAVEMVEAVTIVLAMGLTRGWRAAFWGAALAIVALIGLTLVAGYALIEWLPESVLQLVIGTLLLVFGLQWLRKAILRAAGLKALHDEEEAFAAELAAAGAAGNERKLGLDWFGFVVSFKGVFLEGLEIVFIVITFGLNADDVPLAAAGAVIGGIVVLACSGRASPAARTCPGEHDQVRRRAAALDLRHVLGDRGARGLPGRNCERRRPRWRRRSDRAPGALGVLLVGSPSVR